MGAQVGWKCDGGEVTRLVLEEWGKTWNLELTVTVRVKTVVAMMTGREQ